MLGLSSQSVRGSGQTTEQNKYVSKGPITARVSEILKQIDNIENEQLPALSQAIIDASELITSSISGYIYIPEENDPYGLSVGQLFIMDNAIPTHASKVWRWNLNGLGYSDSGINGMYGIAITMDGKINASYITTGILSADYVRTGLLSSSSGETWINLDDGTFNLGGKVTFDGTNFNVENVFRGGYNQLYGTAAYTLDSWETTGNISVVRNQPAVSDNTESGGAFLIGSGSESELKQTVKTIVGKPYCYMMRYLLSGGVLGPASVTIQNSVLPLTETDDWAVVKGSFIAESTETVLIVKNTNGNLYVADIVLMTGNEVDAWQQAQNEITTSNMTFANGKFKISGNEDDPLETEMTNSAVRVVDSSTNEVKWRISVGGVELDQTVVHKKLTVEPYSGTKAFSIVPQGNGHCYFVIND